eukprot:COSAG01_NODE_1266_length_10987_cov_8.631980_6_plen_88_part_00
MRDLRLCHASEASVVTVLGDGWLSFTDARERVFPRRLPMLTQPRPRAEAVARATRADRDEAAVLAAAAEEAEAASEQGDRVRDVVMR